MRITWTGLARVVAALAVWLAALIPSGGLARTPTTGDVVLFNTVCAQCHEMECSRRLSFPAASSTDEARQHIQSYAGPLSAERIAALSGLVEYTKTACDYYAPDVAIPANGFWSAAALMPLATAERTGWFVPLGSLSAEGWTLTLGVAASQPVALEILTRQGVVAEERLPAGATQTSVNFRAPIPGVPHFLRLRSSGAIDFDKALLSRTRSDDDGVKRK